MHLRGIHHIAIICSDYARSRAFYVGTLGLPIVSEEFRAERNSYKLNLALPDGTQLELFSFPSPPTRLTHPEACGLRHLALRVTSVADAAQIRERVLLVALGAHLERTKMMLVELNNARPVDGHFDISLEQDVASGLLKENRLYRQTAMNTGNYQVGSFLEELERLLLEVAHSPTSAPEAQIEELRQRIEDESLLFKVNVFSSQFESREAAPPAARSNSL